MAFVKILGLHISTSMAAEDIEESNDIPIPVEKTQLVSLLTFLLP